MAGDIYSKAGADAAFVHDTSAGRQALAQSPEVTSTIAAVASAKGPNSPAPSLPAGTEYIWFKTDGAGTLLDIVSGVA